MLRRAIVLAVAAHFAGVGCEFAHDGQRSFTTWNEELEDWWFKNIGEELGRKVKDHDKYWHYKEDTGAKCVDDITEAPSKKPNIIFVLADDWGYGDTGYHNPQIKTPYMNWMAENGLRMEQSYVSPWCTPSRAALMTGKYPHKVGQQRNVITMISLIGLNADEKLLPEYLKSLGYETHLLGKWHLGHCNEAYLPTNRGFDSQYGYMQAQVSPYHKHYPFSPFPIDWFINDTVVTGTKSSNAEEMVPFIGDLLKDRTTEIIKNSTAREAPYFLYLALPHVHWPVEAPLEFTDMHVYEKDPEQRKHYAMLSHMDSMVGNIVRDLKEAGQYDNTIIVVMGDNGGYHLKWDWLPASGTASNYPLRGGKGNLYEGGTRVPSFVHSPLLKSKGVSNKMFHITDWLPTLLKAAGMSQSDMAKLSIDGIDQYDALFHGCPAVRDEFVYGFQENLLDPDDPESNYPNGAVRIGKYKISTINETRLMPGMSCLTCLNPLLPAGTFTVYDLNKDPFEEHDLYAKLSAEEPQLLDSLKSKFFALASEIGPEKKENFTFHVDDYANINGLLQTDFCNLDGTRSKDT